MVPKSPLLLLFLATTLCHTIAQLFCLSGSFVYTRFLREDQPFSGLGSQRSWHPYAQAFLPIAQACASVTDSEGAFTVSYVFCPKLPPSFTAKLLFRAWRHQPRICFKLILHKTILFLEPHCPSLHLSLVQSHSRPALRVFLASYPGQERVRYWLPFQKAQWFWCRMIHLLFKMSSYQKFQRKNSLGEKKVKLIFLKPKHKKMGTHHNKGC